MSIPVIYRDSEKSKYFSTDDFVTLSDYNESFRNAVQTSQLRLAIAPGSDKYWNKQFTHRNESKSQFSSLTPVLPPQKVPTEYKLTPVTNYSSDNFDYMSYPKVK